MRVRTDRQAFIGAGIFLAFGFVASCDALPFVEHSCSGARELQERHSELLQCAGWLPYVEENISLIDYLEVASYESHGEDAVGTAYCGRCQVSVATRDRSALDIVTTLVHEAAHLKDQCRHGEAPADEATASFRSDFEAQGCSGSFTGQIRGEATTSMFGAAEAGLVSSNMRVSWGMFLNSEAVLETGIAIRIRFVSWSRQAPQVGTYMLSDDFFNPPDGMFAALVSFDTAHGSDLERGRGHLTIEHRSAAYLMGTFDLEVDAPDGQAALTGSFRVLLRDD